MSGVVTLDDTNSAATYSRGQWSRQLNNANAFDGSLTFSSVEGAVATIRFQGSSIIVMGAVSSRGRPPTSVYVLDDENPVTFIPPDAPGRALQNGVVFYRSPPLPFGDHILSIMNAEGNTAPLILDGFIVNTQPQSNTPPPVPNPPNTPSVSSTPTISLPSPSTPTPSTTLSPSTSSTLAPLVPSTPSTTSDGLPPVIVTITASRTPTPSGTSVPNSNGALSGADSGDGEKKGGGSNAGAIAGGVVAAIFGIGLLIVAFLFWKRRQRRQREGGGPQPLRRGHSSFWNKSTGPNPTSPPITPFVLDSDLPPSPPSQYQSQSQRRPAPPPPPPPQMSQHPYNQASSRSYAQDRSNGYGQSYSSSTPRNIPPPIIANNRFSSADSMYTDGPGARDGDDDPYGGYAPASAAPPPPLPKKVPALAAANPFYPHAVNTSVTDLSQSVAPPLSKSTAAATSPFYPQAVNTSGPNSQQSQSQSQYQYQSASQYQPQSQYPSQSQYQPQAQTQAQPQYQSQSQSQSAPRTQRSQTTLQYIPPSQAQSSSQYVPPSQLLNARLQGGGSGSGFDSYGRGMPVPGADSGYMYAAQSQGKRERIRLD